MNAWSKYPFIRIVIPFIIGIVLYHECGLKSSLFLAVFILSFGCLFFWNFLFKMPDFRNRWSYGFILNLSIICSALGLSWLLDDRNNDSHFMHHRHDKIALFYAEVTQPAVEKQNSYRLILNVRELAVSEMSISTGFDNKEESKKENYKKLAVSGKMVCYIDKSAFIPDYGDVLVFSKKPFSPEEPGNPGEFDYAKYLSNDNIFHIVYLKKGDFVISERDEGNFLKSFAIKQRNAFLINIANEGLEKPELAVAAAMLTGYDDFLDPVQRKEYTNAGVIHILCVSGLHVGVIFLLAESALVLLKKNRFTQILKPVIILLIIWLYALFTGMATPVLRASFMFSLIVIGRGIKRKTQTINTLSAAAFILLFLNPVILYNIGFQLSFSAVAGILLYQRFIQEWWKPVNPSLINLWNLISVSLAAQIFTLPIILYYFGQFPIYFLLSNIIAIPLSGIIIYTGVASAIVSLIPMLKKFLVIILSAELKVLNFSVSLIESLPGAVINNIYLSLTGAVALFVFFSGALLFIMKKEKKWFYASLTCLCALFILSTCRYYTLRNTKMLVFHKVSNHTLVSFIDSKKHTLIADSSIICNPDLYKMHFQGLTREYGLQKPIFHRMNQNSRENSLPQFFSFSGNRLVFIYGRCVLPDNSKLQNVNYVVLSNNPVVQIRQLSSCFPGAKIVVDCSCSYEFREKIIDDAGKLGIIAYDLNKKALTVEI